MQARWPMARGYPGFFGRGANTWWIWFGLSALFVLPFLRGPPRMLHLDLAVLLAFALSYAAFNAADHWFYLYLVWFAPLVWLALLRAPAAAPTRSSPPAPAASSG
jgi:hypothetical protein